jgi:hypothetical protein
MSPTSTINEATLSRSLDPAMVYPYIEILEKTNQQLGLWTNPYGVMVGVLSFLVGLLAIGVAWMIWRQGKEFREQFEKKSDELLCEWKNRADAELQQVIDGVTPILDQQIAEKMKSIEEQERASASGVNDLLNDAKDELSKLKKAKENLENPFVVSTSPFADRYNLARKQDYSVCEECGTLFSEKIPRSWSKMSFANSMHSFSDTVSGFSLYSQTLCHKCRKEKGSI